ncbi:FtsQ-type POTRA domain-containing protein [Candidatus Saccharibacteria bacterium]|nr:FtsQ-type POTRA domain-containing protein [Candidatus Saccharibacteria bacterium]
MPPRPRGRTRPSFKLGLIPRRLLLLAIALVVVILGLRQVFSIRTITVVPANPTTAAEAKQILGASWSLGNALTFNGSSFSSKLTAMDATIKSVSTTRLLPSGLRVVVTFKQPSLGWLSGNEGHLLDVDGTAIGVLPAGNKLPVVTDDSNLPVTAGQAVVAPRFVSFVTGVSKQLPNTGLTATKYEIKDTTFDLYVTTNKGYQLILDTSRPVGDEMGDLTAVLNNLKQTGKTPAQYIDLRIAGRAYYK